MGDIVPRRLQRSKRQNHSQKQNRPRKTGHSLEMCMKVLTFIVPVIRLVGSKTSIFSSKSTALGDILGNLAEICCFGYCGSCLTYRRALLLRRKPRLASSGEPRSCHTKEKNCGSSEPDWLIL